MERKGAKTALLTTEGFRDVLELGRIRLPVLYDLHWEKPEPLVPRRWRRGIPERLDVHGRTVTPLDEDALRREITWLVEEGITSIAICFLHAYVNASHEQRATAIVRDVHPDVSLSLSSQVLPKAREFERTSTTVADAYVKPLVGRYLARLQRTLSDHGVRNPLLVMDSAGGIAPAHTAAESPVSLIESGPAAGVMGAAFIAKQLGYRRVISFDMGGTTAKASLLEDAQPKWADEFEIGGDLSTTSRLLRGSGYLIATPALDLAEVGSGGGSIVRLDAAGGLHVGPESAGADPGPVCYGRGGTSPTVTDANAVMGLVTRLAGGDVVLDIEAARRALQPIASSRGVSVEEAAWGVHQLANANMIRAIRAVSIERGGDHREAFLLAFGGCGPMHAAAMAAQLGIPHVIVPLRPGVFSATGLLATPPRAHLIRAYPVPLHEADLGELSRLFAQMRDEARQRLGERHDAHLTFDYFVEMQYRGQWSEIPIPYHPSDDRLTSHRRPGSFESSPSSLESSTDGRRAPSADPLRVLEQAFLEEYRRQYGYEFGGDIDIVGVRLVATAPSIPVDWHALSGARTRAQADPPTRSAYWGPDVGWLPTPLFDRGDLSGRFIVGPAIVEEYDTTTVIPPGWQATLAVGNVIHLKRIDEEVTQDAPRIADAAEPLPR